jgi:anti-anti-sigma factor
MPGVSDRTPRHLKCRTEQGVLILTLTDPQLRGDALVNALRHELLAAVAGAPRPKVVLDLSAVSALSSESFRPLLSLRRTVEEQQGRMVLCNLAPVVAQAFQATRLVSTSRSSTATFDVRPDLAAAIASLTSADE